VTSACGSYNLGGSATITGQRLHRHAVAAGRPFPGPLLLGREGEEAKSPRKTLYRVLFAKYVTLINSVRGS